LPALVFNFDIKIDNCIVNNIDCGYHLKKCAETDNHAGGSLCMVAAYRGKWHEESSQGFQRQ
jgi:hypothetical protein